MARERNGVAVGGRRARTREEPRKRDEEVYAAALRLFTEKGYHATSMQDIAAAVGLYKGSLYHYIGSKEELLARVFERGMGTLLDEVDTIAGDTSLAASRQLRLILQAHVTAVAHNREALTVYLHEFRALADEALGNVRVQRDRYRRLVESVVERGVRSGEFGATDVTIATLGVLGMCNWIVEWYRPGGRLGPRQIADHFAELLLRGLYFDPSASSPAVSPRVCTNCVE
ncbi:MAG: TetR family transcriptional regulator [Chloroflexi bacterium]|nr:TetR family transcriptional regulator [Chloroflexota bacterium]